MAGKKERQRKLARERYARQQARRSPACPPNAADGHHRGRACCAVVALGAGAYLDVREQAAASPPSAAAATPSRHRLAHRGPDAHASPRRRLVAEPASALHVHPERHGRPQGGHPARQAAYKAQAYQATIKTNRGTIVLDLLNHKATCTVNSFIYLAAKNYFNNTPCHRLTTAGIYVLQCGDPTGTGSGGPGYKFANENLAGAKYTQGTVAMANAGPGTNGSQFFLVYRNSQRCRRTTRRSAKSSADWESSRMWPRQAQTTATATVMAIRRRRSPSKASLLLRPDTPFTRVQV